MKLHFMLVYIIHNSESDINNSECEDFLTLNFPGCRRPNFGDFSEFPPVGQFASLQALNFSAFCSETY